MKSLLNLKKIGVAVLIGISVLSCETNVEESVVTDVMDQPDEGNQENENPDVESPTILSFSQNVKPIIDSRCVECHRGNRFPDLRTHAVIAQNSALIQNVVVTGRMPLGGSLSDQQIETISDWIDSGTLDN